MSRVVLVVGVNPYLNNSPSLGICYLAASLLQRGHQVEVIDVATPYGPDAAYLAERIAKWKPHIVGVGLFTDSALRTYQLLEDIPLGSALLVAGGAHATSVPFEPLERGFDVTVIGEGERTIVELADLVEQTETPRSELNRIARIAYTDETGAPARTRSRPRLHDLDSLAPPYEGVKIFPRHWYLPDGKGQLASRFITSRGCQGACIFCANNVTGKRHRTHSVKRVIDEVKEYFDREGYGLISFHDDGFTADRQRLFSLLDAFAATYPGSSSWWWCESRVDHFDSEMARRMKAAGCHTVVFGVESGHPDILKLINKRIHPDDVIRALTQAREAGLIVYANFMLGFPGEEVSHLETTLRFMERLAPIVHHFNPLGLVIPYPGTPLYRRYADEYGFKQWWLDETRMGTMYDTLPKGGYTSLPGNLLWVVLAQLEEAILAADFFRYSDKQKAAIRRCMEFRREHAVPVEGTFLAD